MHATHTHSAPSATRVHGYARDERFVTGLVGAIVDAIRPTGPFDADPPVLVVETTAGLPVATLFNHATHTIGSRLPRKRSPAFYGLAAQELEDERGGAHLFLQGASGSTHNLVLGADEMVVRIKDAVTGYCRKRMASGWWLQRVRCSTGSTRRAHRPTRTHGREDGATAPRMRWRCRRAQGSLGRPHHDSRGSPWTSRSSSRSH